MWLVIDKKTGRVLAIETGKPPEGAYKSEFFDIKEWVGPTPRIPGLDTKTGQEIPGDPDPTLTDPTYSGFKRCRADFEALGKLADKELAWLEETIPKVDDMTPGELRPVLGRVLEQNYRMIRAWKYLVRRLQ